MDTEITGIVLAGGKGTRLYPLTEVTNKHLLPLYNKQLILWNLDQMVSAGIETVILIIDERNANEYLKLIKDGSHLGLKGVSYVWQSSEGSGLPTAISKVERFIKSNKIMVACGDVLIDANLKKLANDFISKEFGAVIVGTYINDTAGYSVLKYDKNNNVKRILQKNSSLHTKGVIDLGIYFYDKKVFDYIPRLSASARGETEIWDLNNIYISNNSLGVRIIEGWWSDVGLNYNSYLEAFNHMSARVNEKQD